MMGFIHHDIGIFFRIDLLVMPGHVGVGIYVDGILISRKGFVNPALPVIDAICIRRKDQCFKILVIRVILCLDSDVFLHDPGFAAGRGKYNQERTNSL